MTQEEKIAIAETVRHRDRFGPVSQEELAALSGKETELWIQTKSGYCVHVFEERPEALPDRAPILLNFHGGGFLKGRTDRERRYCCAVMEATNALVWDVDYSLAPENRSLMLQKKAMESYSMCLNMQKNCVSIRKKSCLPDIVPEAILWHRLW